MGCFLTWLWSEPDAVTFVCSLLQHWAKLSYKLLFSYFHISACTMFKSLVYKNLTAQFRFRRHVHESNIILLASLLLAEAQNYIKYQCHISDLFELVLLLIINKLKQTQNILKQILVLMFPSKDSRKSNGIWLTICICSIFNSFKINSTISVICNGKFH